MRIPCGYNAAEIRSSEFVRAMKSNVEYIDSERNKTALSGVLGDGTKFAIVRDLFSDTKVEVSEIGIAIGANQIFAESGKSVLRIIELSSQAERWKRFVRVEKSVPKKQKHRDENER